MADEESTSDYEVWRSDGRNRYPVSDGHTRGVAISHAVQRNANRHSDNQDYYVVVRNEIVVWEPTSEDIRVR